jgi:hypothetical protein
VWKSMTGGLAHPAAGRQIININRHMAHRRISLIEVLA